MEKILHLCLCGPYNEGWNYQENILPKYHHRLGFEVKVLATPYVNSKKNTRVEFYRRESYIDINGVIITRLKTWFNIKNYLMFRLGIYTELYDSLQSYDPNIIFVHGFQFLSVSKLIKYLKNNKNVRVFVDEHSDYNNSARNFLSKHILHKFIWRYFAHRLSPHVETFWGVLPSRVDFLRDAYKIKENSDLLLMGIDDDEIIDIEERTQKFKNEYNLNDNFIIISGGKIDNNKTEIIQLMKAVRNIENIKLLIFGSVTDELKLDFERNLNNNILYIGWIDSSKTYEVINSADLVVFPGSHSVMWEQAVALKKPSIFKYFDGMQHLDLGGNCVFLNDTTSENLSKVISNILLNTNKYRDMELSYTDEKVNKFLYSNIAKRSIKYDMKIQE